MFQKLDVSHNLLCSLPRELCSLEKLRTLDLSDNAFTAVPVSVLSELTALRVIAMNNQCDNTYSRNPSDRLMVSESLLPILHPGLVRLELQQEKELDPVSLGHVGSAMLDLGNRQPVPTLLFNSISNVFL